MIPISWVVPSEAYQAILFPPVGIMYCKALTYVAVIPVADKVFADVLYDRAVTVLKANPLPEESLVDVRYRVVAPAAAKTETDAAAAVTVAHFIPKGRDVSTVKT